MMPKARMDIILLFSLVFFLFLSLASPFPFPSPGGRRREKTSREKHTAIYKKDFSPFHAGPKERATQAWKKKSFVTAGKTWTVRNPSMVSPLSMSCLSLGASLRPKGRA